MAAASFLAGASEPERGRDQARPRGQPLPLHRLPQHRQGRAGRGERLGDRDGNHRARDGWVRRHEPAPQGRPGADHRPGTYVDNIALPGMLWVGLVRSPFAHAKINSIDVSKALRARGRVSRRTPAPTSSSQRRSSWPGRSTTTQAARASPAREGQGPLRRRRRRRRRRRVTRARQGRDRAGRGRLGAAAAVIGIKEALEEDAPLVHDEFGTNDAGTWSIEADSPVPRRGPSSAVLRGPRPGQDQGGVLPRPPDPERDRAARCRRRPERRHGRVHGLLVDPDPAHPADDARDHVRHPRGEAARGRAGRRRRLRLEARVYPEDAICLALAKSSTAR